ncbi:MAG: hypothetical protein NTX52_15270, partial [Planctomycetota bacterium]|nr:hypothetical protein [Planctomycetota bacterium]
ELKTFGMNWLFFCKGQCVIFGYICKLLSSKKLIRRRRIKLHFCKTREICGLTTTLPKCGTGFQPVKTRSGWPSHGVSASILRSGPDKSGLLRRMKVAGPS